MKKIIISLCCVLVISGSSFASSFSDVSPVTNYSTAIEYLVSTNTLKGYADGTFKPLQTINRAELMKVLVAGQGISPDANVYKNCFSDVKDEWFAPFVCYAKDKSWVSGYSDNSFKPTQSVKRAEALKMLVNSMSWSLSEGPYSLDSYSDISLNEWYTPYLNIADKVSLVLNKNRFGAAEDMSRGEVSEYIFRALVISENGMNAYTNELRDSFLSAKSTEVSELFEVSRVVDGDTIYLTNGDKIRLLGINSPEVGYCYYSEATAYLKALIGDSKISMKDDSTNEDKDRYGRLLRYIYVNGELLNIKMVQEGYAEYMKEYPIIYSADFSEAESMAKSADKGMWGSCDLSGVDSSGDSGSAVVPKNDATGLYINKVFYDGIVPTVESDEYVEVKNGGSSAINLKGFFIKGSKGTEVFTFPDITLGAGESVKVYTNQGTYSFGSTKAIWNNGGETAYLYGSDGGVVDAWGW